MSVSQKRSFTSRIFNFRLFIEGLKRLRVIGLATAIPAIAISAIIPICTWIDMESYNRNREILLENNQVCIPAACIILIAPFFFLTLFSFLQKRRDSDFFHAIPYTRTCVYISFTTAALTMIGLIQAACGAVAALLWSACPYTTYDSRALVAYICLCFLAAAMLSSFMMLALSVSGTAGSCMLLFMLFACFWRIVCFIFMEMLTCIELLSSSCLLAESFLSPYQFLPISIAFDLFDDMDAQAWLFSARTLIYSVLVTVLIFVIAAVIYVRRHSEMAGNPAPGRHTQTLFRVLFSLIPAFISVLLLTQEIFDRNGYDMALYIVLIAITLLVYFLYELITTKRPRAMLVAVRQLWMIPAACALFFGIYFGYRAILLNDTPTADKIESVSIENNLYQSGTYQAVLSNQYFTENTEIIGIVAEQLRYSAACEGEDDTENYYKRTEVTIRQKNGRTITRSIILGDDDYAAMADKLWQEEAVQAIRYALPNVEDVDSAYVWMNFAGISVSSGYIDITQTETLVRLFREEFDTLTDAQKDEVMFESLNSYDSRDDIYLSNYLNKLELSAFSPTANKGYSNTYIITEHMPKTLAYMLGIVAQDDQNYCEFLLENNHHVYGENKPFLSLIEGYLNDYPEITLLNPVSLQILTPFGKVVLNENVRMEAADAKELVNLLKGSIIEFEDQNPTTWDISENTYVVMLEIADPHYLNAWVFGLFELSDESLLNIRAWLSTEPA